MVIGVAVLLLLGLSVSSLASSEPETQITVAGVPQSAIAGGGRPVAGRVRGLRAYYLSGGRIYYTSGLPLPP